MRAPRRYYVLGTLRVVHRRRPPVTVEVEQEVSARRASEALDKLRQIIAWSHHAAPIDCDWNPQSTVTIDMDELVAEGAD